ncbi:MAG: large conductance mechanosensitive channel protein MscL [Lachnospiraceae bacterium]|nr:large conductance mechanosensitive channel protein MscL [Lachnospiraceae bacterium]
MKIVKEFKEFISRGNVIDMAVGIIIGGAFTAIVNSLVSDVVSPVLGLFGTTNLEEFKWVIKEGVAAADGTIEGGVVLAYGSFITAVINFLIMALIVFILVKIITSVTNVFKKKEEEAPAEPTTKICPFCKSEVNIEATKCPHCTSDLTE